MAYEVFSKILGDEGGEPSGHHPRFRQLAARRQSDTIPNGEEVRPVNTLEGGLDLDKPLRIHHRRRQSNIHAPQGTHDSRQGRRPGCAILQFDAISMDGSHGLSSNPADPFARQETLNPCHGPSAKQRPQTILVIDDPDLYPVRQSPFTDRRGQPAGVFQTRSWTFSGQEQRHSSLGQCQKAVPEIKGFGDITGKEGV